MTSTESLILDELKSLRAVVDELAKDTRQRITYLEAHDHDVSGNGQPGRLKAVEDRMSTLEHWRIYVLGFSAAISAAVCFAIKFLL